MQSNKLKPFIIIIIFWMVIFSGYVGFKEYTLNQGKEFILPVIPVDPSDLLRGDYVILNYYISRIKDDSFYFSLDELKIGDTIYVQIYNNLSFPETTYVYTELNQVYNYPNSIVLKGRIQDRDGSSISVSYNIEKFFIQRGTGGEIEEGIRNGNAFVKLSVDRFGNAVIKSLIIGEKIYE